MSEARPGWYERDMTGDGDPAFVVRHYWTGYSWAWRSTRPRGGRYVWGNSTLHLNWRGLTKPARGWKP